MNRAGKTGEDLAVKLLEGRGMRIIARNVRSPAGEIDLVALEGEAIAFVEVKAWGAYGLEDLALSIGPKKRRRIIETAKYFLASHRQYNCKTPRFDVLFIGQGAVNYLPSAFMENL